MEAVCPLCSKGMSWVGLSKHIFSSAHRHELPALILAANAASDLRLPNRLPVIRNKDENKNDIHLCFGCKKCWLTPKPDHFSGATGCKGHEMHKASVAAVLSGTTATQSVATAVLNAKDAEIEALKKRVQMLQEDAAWEKKEKEAAEAKLEALEEESGVEELKAAIRSRDTLIGRLIGVTESEEMFALNEKLRVAGYKVDRPLFDLQKALDPPAPPPAAPAPPPAAPSLGPNAIVTSHTTHLQTSYHPTAQQQEALGQFSGVKVLATTTKRPGKLLIPR